MSAIKLISYFLSHPVAFGFVASSAPDITLNPANKKTDQSLSDFHTVIDAAVLATLDRYTAAYFHTTTTLVDTIASL